MKKLERPPAPERLQQNYRQWGRDYAAGGHWSWREGIDKDIRPLLLQMTGEHCAFCDAYPLKPSKLDPEIGHFKPKYISPLLAYVWHNLFPICRECNNCQGNKFYKIVAGRKVKPLKPDQDNYDFSAYFFFDPRSGKIESNPVAEPSAKIRAEHTIELFGLNHEKRPNLRKSTIRRFLALSRSNDEGLDPSDLYPENYAFGFFIQMVVEAGNSL